MKRPRSILILTCLACLPALLLAIDLTVYTAQDRKEFVHRPDEYHVPDDVLVPATASYELKGAELQAFLARGPLLPGAPAPRIDAVDFRKEHLRIPPTDGKPMAWAVSDGSVDGASVLHELVHLNQRVGGQLHIGAFVATHSHYVWGHHGGTFWQTPLQAVLDEDGQYYRQMRPPGKNPTALPSVFACDGHGVIRYVAQPDPQAAVTWPAAIQRALHLTSVTPGNRG